MEETKTKKTNNLLEWVIALVLAIVFALFLTQVVFVNAVVPSGSMENTINVNDRILGFRLSYWFKQPVREDVVIFKFPDDEKQLFIKRIVGMPGDDVEIINGVVHINGEVVEEDYIKEPTIGNYGPYKVPEGNYFVLGDNRQNSKDSRFWDNTFVSEKKILGRAICRIFPNPSGL